jgi:Asp-tRNA(Asn)/Glu-tRNA(Gln) amidotransferase A subunit family amidase
MDRGDLAFAGVARQAELVRAGEVSSVELVELYLERIQRLEPGLEMAIAYPFTAIWNMTGQPAIRSPRRRRATACRSARS